MGEIIANGATDGESGLLAVSHGAAIVLLLEFASYLWFFYYTHSDLADNGPIPSLKPALAASVLQPALVAHPNLGNELQSSNAYRSLRELRAAAQAARADEDKPRYHIYANALLLACSLTAMAFASIYVLEAIEAPSRSMKLSKSFVGLVVMPTIIAAVEHITAVLRSRKEDIALDY